MHSAEVRSSLDDVVHIVQNSGFVDDEYDTSARALVMCFVAADLPLPPAGRQAAVTDLRAGILVDHLLREALGYGNTLERRLAFLGAVQAAVAGCFRNERSHIDALRAEVGKLAAAGRLQASLPVAGHAVASLADVDEGNEGDL